MPEKPEVITVSNNLRPRLVGKKITGCNVYWDNIIAYPTTDEFKKDVIGQKILDVTTRGKFIKVLLDRDVLLIHLRMEGKFFFRKKNDPIVKHEHVEFILDDDISGYEFDDSDLTKKYLYEKLHNKKLPIKTVLLDQSIITGIGNIYDDEILFRSKISPYRKSCDISLEECDEIIKNTRLVLSEAIKKGGTTIKSFTSSEGVHGLFQNELLVHGKKKAECPVCGSEIEVCRIGGRGTYYCTKCQK